MHFGEDHSNIVNNSTFLREFCPWSIDITGFFWLNLTIKQQKTPLSNRSAKTIKPSRKDVFMQSILQFNSRVDNFLCKYEIGNTLLAKIFAHLKFNKETIALLTSRNWKNVHIIDDSLSKVWVNKYITVSVNQYNKGYPFSSNKMTTWYIK